MGGENVTSDEQPILACKLVVSSFLGLLGCLILILSLCSCYHSVEPPPYVASGITLPSATNASAHPVHNHGLPINVDKSGGLILYGEPMTLDALGEIVRQRVQRTGGLRVFIAADHRTKFADVWKVVTWSEMDGGKKKWMLLGMPRKDGTSIKVYGSHDDVKPTKICVKYR